MQAQTAQRLATLLKYDPPYEWRGGAHELLQSTAPEVILVGPAETGKTFAACYKAHMLCREYPGAQGALIRKVAATIPGTVFLTMKRVIGKFPVTMYGGDNSPSKIIYPNGSAIWLGGMDDPSKVLSGERDFICVCQAEELALNDWEVITTRNTGRGAIIPHPQTFGDCNPAGTSHFIRQRERIVKLRSKHVDNPTLYDKRGMLTKQGERTMAALQSLTGVRRKRLYEGEWATAEGVVYDMFEHGVHVKPRPRSEMKRWFLGVDEGYTNPAVCLLIGEDSDGRLHIDNEFYKTGVLQSDFIKYVLTLNKEFPDAYAYVDEAAAGLIAEMLNNSIPCEGSKGRVLDGIQAVQDILKIAGDGSPRLTVDPSCVNTINNFESYVWKPGKDEPQKEHDHALDALRYTVIKVVSTSWLTF